jgi:hypothetical protein
MVRLPKPRWAKVRPADDPHHYILKYMLFHALSKSKFPWLVP